MVPHADGLVANQLKDQLLLKLNQDKSMEHNDVRLNAESRSIWDVNAVAWDAKIAAGSGWQSTLIAPAVERLLNVQAGERILDIACGNGHFSRRLLELGATVVASDFSTKLIELAKHRTARHSDRITFCVADATDEVQLLSLNGPESPGFDAAVCNMALMDMPAIEPMFRAVSKLLKPEGRFVFSIMHPCFNGLAMAMQPELPDDSSTPNYSIKVSRYLSAEVTRGLAIREQPLQQYYWHRPLHILFNAAFSNGLVMDRIEEPSPKTDAPAKGAFDWANYDMPPVLFARLRPVQ